MLKSVFVTAFRNIFRNGSFSVINLIGLSVSMSLGMLIILIVKDQYSFDRFHKDSDRIYRVNTRALRTNGETEPYASSPLPLGRALKEEYALADKVVSITRALRGDAVYGNIEVPVRGLIVDPSFLDVFNFPLTNGLGSRALDAPNSLVLTPQAAEKIFGSMDPTGQSLTIKGFGDFIVTGVLNKLQNKTHFDFEILASSAGLPGWENMGAVSSSINDWTNYYHSYTYFRLQEGKSVAEVEKALSEISHKYYSDVKLEIRDKGYEFYLHPLNEITPGPELSNQMGNSLPSTVSMLIAALAAIVMVMACFNYTNLMIAKSISRAREIGVRKVMGAMRWEVFGQFIGEAIIFAVCSLAASYLMLQLLKPAFLQLHITNEFSIDLNEDLATYALFFLFALTVGTLAGCLPAGYLSAFRPAAVLKDGGNLKVYSRLTLRQILMVTQFTLSIIFIVFVFVVQGQIDFMLGKSYGINEKDILNIRLEGVAYEKLANEVRNLPGVVQVAGISHSLGTWSDRSSDYKKEAGGEPFEMRDFLVDENYLSNVDAPFIAGRNFTAESNGAVEKHVILNEEALRLFGFKDPASALGQAVYVYDSVSLEVIGVVKNFNFRPLTYQIGPVAFRCNTSELTLLSARILPGQRDAIVASLGTIWKRLDPVHPLTFKMMDTEIDEAYQRAGFTDIAAVVGYVTFLAIVLACLGMLGMAMYSSKTRIKEIGIRKVMGAGVSDIAFLLSRSFLWMISIAAVVGVPIAILVGQGFLSLYAYKIDITPLLVLGSVCIIGVLGLVTISSQTLRAASANPVTSLRYE
ncbi:MAG TPA: ABC transporter permease [Cyclobacteriaceae bacterium]|nr:ABC transporter permease [Cyclobacteriaceae bacterium]